jgi:iron complex outermembrane recepter protein
VPAGTRADDNYTDFSPMASISWHVSDDTTVYAKVAKAFKSGGFNTTANTVQSFESGFDSEELVSYELGWKSELLNRRLRLNGALFYSDYTDIQLTNFIPSQSGGAISFIDNAGEATIKGLELEMVALLTQDLQLSGSYGYLDGEYGEYKVFDPALGVEIDAKNARELPFQPESTASLALDYQRELGDIGTLTARLAWTYGGSYYIYTENAETTKAESRSVFNGRIGIGDIPLGCCGTLDLALWGKNLGDEEYRQHGIDFGAFGFAFNQYGDPRTYGVEAVYRFE